MRTNYVVQIFSSPDLVVVSAICASASSDQEAILEDLVIILDAYKYTLPIIRLGITKEIQSTGTASFSFFLLSYIIFQHRQQPYSVEIVLPLS